MIVISALQALDNDRKARKYMSKAINYTDAPAEIDNVLDSAVPIDGLLSSPSELVRKTEKEELPIQ